MKTQQMNPTDTADELDDVSVTVGDGRGEYYVYALSLTPVDEGFDLRNIFYVGKGKGARWQQHFKDTVTDLRRRDVDATVTLSAKKQTISDLIDAADGDLDIERHAYLVEWSLTEAEALRTEALVIKMMRSYGNVLTNEVAGHHEAEVLMPAGEVRRFYAAEKAEIERVRTADLADFLPGGPREREGICVVVKGSSEEMPLSPDIIGDGPVGHFWDAEAGEPFEDVVRRGWDPRWPWSDDEARERARHYWPVGDATADILAGIAEDGRLTLAMAITDPRARQTVVRYSWVVDDTDERWLRYLGTGRVGFPLGTANNESWDPWLGKCLIREEDGKQLLEAMAGGIGYAAYQFVD
ncbi:GIY-YIG nuclease family protein [uncultured Corynebacterium sp.]|uniref:GIY-YIG nuclease family protein n=1 Tax=uncultured Corynebacterium sp. TaxID=159447 RepID=UPI0025DBC554|nr:GIY-YIG nuclease family protein [uncultured Corynebacterium sp.]